MDWAQPVCAGCVDKRGHNITPDREKLKNIKMRIEFKLNGNPYAIEVDDKCYTAIKVVIRGEERKRKYTGPMVNQGQIADEYIGYCSKLSYAALKCCRAELSASPDTVSLKEFAARCEAINKQLTDQFDALGV